MFSKGTRGSHTKTHMNFSTPAYILVFIMTELLSQCQFNRSELLKKRVCVPVHNCRNNSLDDCRHKCSHAGTSIGELQTDEKSSWDADPGDKLELCGLLGPLGSA